MKPKSKVLIIAGSDSSGGAGIQADIKTVTALGSYATTAVTAVTAQNTKGVKKITSIPTSIVEKQIIMLTTLQNNVANNSIRLDALSTKIHPLIISPPTGTSKSFVYKLKWIAALFVHSECPSILVRIIGLSEK